MQRPLSLAQDLLGGAADHDRARLAQGDAGELEERLVADHDLLDDVALPDLEKENDFGDKDYSYGTYYKEVYYKHSA